MPSGQATAPMMTLLWTTRAAAWLPMKRGPRRASTCSRSFVAQGTGKAQPGPQAEPAPEVTLAELDRRLARIEELLAAATASSSQRPAGAPEPHAGSDSP